ncbi:hypothetical protein CUJ83_05775 [Methanocella sp. CWC-04]|uniref:Cupin type-2 domain-containing protein n=1 Tax=Methanooceanicella nereidis TaxID=2052831 RepID=A0AAP2W5N7_9EURY|nr:cupin domain-containing protein [Methanocella sp. CWC-04]MCD1294508.1 hypothetical protein [Methanocella sp. CWC-04]
MQESDILKEEAKRVFDLDDYRQGKKLTPNEVPVYESKDHRIRLWTVMMGQTLPFHKHTDSECIMIVMGGMGEYRSAENEPLMVDEGMMMVSPPGRSHGIKNVGNSPLVVLTIEGPGKFDNRLL